MAEDSIQVQYHQGLKPLEKLLSGVCRPGDFFIHGLIELPMPKLDVDGVGVVSFPVPESQIRQIIQQAERAPYGRGEDTILDPSVRKVWQVPPAKVRVGGKSWANSFQTIMGRVVDGLGCGDDSVSAEFYKLLIYDQGGFFLAHRDTEKADGMFGTLVIGLPSFHRGGELVIRHAGREITVDLSRADVSELAFAAFYADCEHEIRPIVEGNRVCLIYNLIQKHAKKEVQSPLTAPIYNAEMVSAAEMIKEAMNNPDAPAKIVWLLEHQYSPAGLSFTGLKNADAAKAKVLAQAAEQAQCAVHLGIVHIEESGPAQPNYDDYQPRGWGRYGEEEVEEDASSKDFEVIEVSDSWQYVDEWVDAKDRRVDFGKIPLRDGELLPDGALDDEKPDEQRLMEASGNEGADFERSYHRAAMVLWRQDRFADVLLQAGVGAVMPYLKERVEACVAVSAKPADRGDVVALAGRVLEAWESAPEHQFHRHTDKEPGRAEMIEALGRLGDAALLERFLAGIVIRKYDGSENQALASHARLLKPAQAGKLLIELANENMKYLHGACVDLLRRLSRKEDGKLAVDQVAIFQKLAAAIVEGLGSVEGTAPRDLPYAEWERAEKAKPPDAALIADLFDALDALGAGALREKAAISIAVRPAVFDPGKVVVPALKLLHERRGRTINMDPAFHCLWKHAAEFLLDRSERPPEPPKNWQQNVKLSCQCEDCRSLQAFVLDPVEQIHRFRVRQDRRQHLHQMIEKHNLDMTHVTERKGSPQTLVCAKTRRAYQQRCEQYKADIRSFGHLHEFFRGIPGDDKTLLARMTETGARAETWSPRL